jgi:membrane protease YdiL (CAAX protease family)
VEGPHGRVPFDPATGDWLEGDAATLGAPATPPPDAPRHGVGPILWSLLLGIDLTLLGVSLVAVAYSTFTGQGGGLEGTGIDVRTALWGQVAFNLLTLGVIPLAWVAGTRLKPWEGAVRYLRLEHPLRGTAVGVLWGLATLAALILLGLLLRAAGYDPPNEQADAILKAVTPALALALAFSAAVGEEIFFRGLVQRRLGVWGQAVLFGLFHLSYGTPLQVILPALLGLLYGFLVKRGAPLWTTMAAHFVFDYAQLTTPFWLPAP